MKEIKFRVWDKNEQQMCNVVQIDFCKFYAGKEILVEAIVDIPYSYWLSPDNLELMQYTGLKDKNGKEIYDGDICKEILIGQVIYEAPTFWIVTPKGSHSHLNNDCEVIGNIYENPELIKL